MARNFNAYSRKRNDVLTDGMDNYIDKELEKQKKQRIYTTEIIEELKEKYNNGDQDTDMRPFFHGQLQIRNAGITYKYTPEEWECLKEIHASNDPVSFVTKYAVFMTDKGRRTVKLRKYQEELLHLLGDEVYDPNSDIWKPLQKNIIICMSRQVGKSTTTAAWVAYYAITHKDRTIALLSNKFDNAKNLLSLVTTILTNIPFQYQIGVLSMSNAHIKLENGVSIRAYPATTTAITGLTCHVCVCDEYAKLTAKMQSDIFTSVYPALSSSEISQLVLMSTPDGKNNEFYRIWQGAIDGSLPFAAKKVHYWEVPEHATPEWRENTIKTFGEARFAQEFELSWDHGENKVVSPNDMNFFYRIKKQFRSVDIYGVPKRISEKILWHPDFHPDTLNDTDLLSRRFLLQIDTAQGILKNDSDGQSQADFNVINIYEIEFLSPCRILKNRLGYKEVKMMDVIRFRQVGIYIDQDFNEEISASVSQHIVFTILKNGISAYNGEVIDNCRIMIEINFNGVNWIKQFKKHDLFYSSLLIKTYHSLKATKKDFGFKTVSGQHGKGYWCEQGALMIQKRQIIISQDADNPSMSTLQQVAAFGKNKRGSYGGDAIHDDIAVTVFFVSIVMESEDFAMWIEDWFRLLPTLDIPYELKVLHEKISRLMNIYVEQEYDDDQYSVNDIKSLYGNAGSGFGQLSKTYDPYAQQSQSPQRSMMPGGGFSSSPSYPTPGFPSNPGFGQYSQGSRYNNNPFGSNPFQR